MNGLLSSILLPRYVHTCTLPPAPSSTWHYRSVLRAPNALASQTSYDKAKVFTLRQRFRSSSTDESCDRKKNLNTSHHTVVSNDSDGRRSLQALTGDSRMFSVQLSFQRSWKAAKPLPLLHTFVMFVVDLPSQFGNRPRPCPTLLYGVTQKRHEVTERVPFPQLFEPYVWWFASWSWFTHYPRL